MELLELGLMETDEFSLLFDEDRSFTQLNFKKKCCTDGYHGAYMELIEVFKNKHHHKHLTDTTQMGVISVENQNWVKENIVPSMRKFADKEHTLNIALVLGKDVFATFAAKNIARKFDGERNIEIQFFGTVDDAKSWLSSID